MKRQPRTFFLRSIPFRFTRQGKIFLLLIVGVIFAALNTGNNLLYLVLSFQFSMVVSQFIIAEFTLRSLKINRQTPKRANAGTEFPIELSITNQRKHFSAYSASLRDVINHERFRRSCYFLKTAPNESRSIDYRCDVAKRGYTHFTAIDLSTRFPFGLIERSKRIALKDKVLVWPRKVPVRIPDKYSFHQEGTKLSPQRGWGDEFWQLREFVSSDDPKKISWKASAKTGRLVVTDTQAQTDEQAEVVLDLSDIEDEHEGERLIQIAASMVAQLNSHRIVTKLITHETGGIWNNGADIHAQLDHLALLNIKTAKDVRVQGSNRTAIYVGHELRIISPKEANTTSPGKENLAL